jgi:hypothetical protein
MQSRRNSGSLAAVFAGAALLAACGQAPAPTASASGIASSTLRLPPAAPAGTSTAAAGAAGALDWASLGNVAPLSIQPNLARLAADAAHPGVLAVCVAGAVRISRDGGATWSEASTSGVPAALSATNYAIPMLEGQSGSVPACESAVADPVHGASVYAVYAVGKAQYGMPPVFHAAVYTADGGRTWKAVPPPSGFDAGGFGGLSVTPSGAIQAIFGRAVGAGQTQPPPFALTATSDGAKTWSDASLACPAGGVPCLRWGPAPSGTGSCAMHDYPQPIEVSGDGGKTWSAAYDPTQEDLANGCDLNELVGLGAARALLVGRDANGAASVRVTGDGGHTWAPVALPSLPPGTGPAPDSVQMLPDGALLTVVSGQASQPPVDLLAPGASAWCTVPGLTIGGTYTDPGSLQPAGDRLIWLERATANGTPALKSVPLSSVRC